MIKDTYKLGKGISQWKDNAQSLCFIVTEDCNLRCKYCYITHKATNAKMSLNVAKQFIDYVLSDNIKKQEAVILDFIGGEPFIEVDLIDQICDYFKIKAYESNNDWYWNYRISISTNGINYSSKEVQRFIAKNKGKLSVGISIDGTKEKHDSQRVFPDDSGSYDIIKKSIPLYISQFGGHTKATFSSDDIKFLKDSIISLWENGITDVAANVVFEDVWKDGDDSLLEEQLVALADYALENHLFDKYICTFFNDSIGGFVKEDDLRTTYCGAGKMLAVGTNGNIYPCLRYKDYSLNKHSEWTLGNVSDGIDMERVRPFMTAIMRYQNDIECTNCEVAYGCAFCQGYNYDEAETPTNFSRVKYMCKMHKARVRANDYYFSKLFNLYGIEKEEERRERKKLYFLLSDDYITYCQHENLTTSLNFMDNLTLLDGLKYAHYNFMDPIFIHPRDKYIFKNMKNFDEYRIHHIVPAKFYNEVVELRDYILVFDKYDLDLPINDLDVCQLNIDSHDISNFFEYIKKLFQIAKKININIFNLDKYFDEVIYSEQLTKIINYLVELNNIKGNEYYKINIIDDFITEINERFPTHKNCKSGDRSFAYAPNGKFYVCSAYYSVKPEYDIGNVQEGKIKLKNQHLYKAEYQPLCSTCDAYQCYNCVYLNENTTREVNVSPSYQCRKSHIEREVAEQYLIMRHQFSGISHIEFRDPIEKFINENYKSSKDYHGIYKY